MFGSSSSNLSHPRVFLLSESSQENIHITVMACIFLKNKLFYFLIFYFQFANYSFQSGFFHKVLLLFFLSNGSKDTPPL